MERTVESGVAVYGDRADLNPLAFERAEATGVPPSVHDWRRRTRAKLLAQRLLLSKHERRRVRAAVCASLSEQLGGRLQGCVGLYWPFCGEVDLHDYCRGLRDVDLALPVSLGEEQPLEYWTWRPGSRLVPGRRNALTPPVRQLACPTVLLVPLVGFDVAGYRLGYGGGSYDRTLAGLATKPLIVGVGYEFARLATIRPQPHDVPMDVIVTEARVQWSCRH
jgi:5-formyltetrahydrofolate cyclo-ligase